MIYYLPAKARRLFKPYDRRQARRDLHDAGNLSQRLSGQLRRQRRQHPPSG